MKEKFLICERCGNIVGMIKDIGAPLSCCHQKMKELVPNTSDGATEKHVPQVTLENNKVLVQVGSTLHPMEEKHYIAWVYIKTNLGGQRKELVVPNLPKVEFALCEGEVVEAVYAYCNLHGLWKKELN